MIFKHLWPLVIRKRNKKQAFLNRKFNNQKIIQNMKLNLEVELNINAQYTFFTNIKKFSDYQINLHSRQEVMATCFRLENSGRLKLNDSQGNPPPHPPLQKCAF